MLYRSCRRRIVSAQARSRSDPPAITSPRRAMPWWGAKKVKVDKYVVKTIWGEVRGRRKDKRAVFYGVPYAAPPVGPLRFQKPQDPAPWTGVRCCRGPAPQAVQSFSLSFRPFVPWRLLGDLLTGIVWLMGRDPRANTNIHKPQKVPKHMSEDCLYLDVELPLPLPTREEGDGGVGAKPALRPVMVWFHGGSFQVGSNHPLAYEPSTRGHGLCVLGEVIVVKVQYRLGLWGFLKMDGGHANNGIWDQVKALQWVQANIRAFGGDPENVTIFGESAGGISAGIHLLAPPSQGLFHKAILTSGCLQPAVPLPAHETHVSAPVAQLLAPLLPSPTSAMTAQALQGVSAAQLLCAQCLLILQSGQKQCLEAGPLLLQPIADGELLPFHSNGNKLQHVMEHGLGRGSKVQSVMVGHCRDEDGLFEALTPQHFHCNSLLHCRERVRELLTDALPPSESILDSAMSELQAYHTSMRQRGEGPMVPVGGEWTDLFVMASGLYRFILPSHLTAHALLQGPQEAGARPRVYMFRFDVGNVRLKKGAVHSMDLAYVFGTTRLSKPLLPGKLLDNHRLHEMVAGAWTSFAHTGTPRLPLPSPPPSSLCPPAASPDGLPWPPLLPSPSSSHAVVVLDVPVARVRVECVDLQQALPTLWALCQQHGQKRPLFLTDAQA